jgi:hypothetical protein
MAALQQTGRIAPRSGVWLHGTFGLRGAAETAALLRQIHVCHGRRALAAENRDEVPPRATNCSARG